MTTSKAEVSRVRMAKAADAMALCADNPACVDFKESVVKYRKKKQWAATMEQRTADLSAEYAAPEHRPTLRCYGDRKVASITNVCKPGITVWIK